MPYNSFTNLAQTLKTFDLKLSQCQALVSDTVFALEINPYLADNIQENIYLASASNSEKARSEFLIAPILVEARRLLGNKVSLFSGTEFSVQPENNLTGLCDFLITKSKQQLIIEAPVFMLVESKKADLATGYGQVVSEMVAARIFNQQENNNIDKIYGCVTTGMLWQFLVLEEDKITIELEISYILPLENLLKKIVKILDE